MFDATERLAKGFALLFVIVVAVTAYARLIIWVSYTSEIAAGFLFGLPFIVGISWLLGGKA